MSMIDITSSQNIDFGYEYQIIDATSGNLTLSLPQIPYDGIWTTFTRIDNSSNTVSIVPYSGDNIMGLSSLPLYELSNITLSSWGANRWILTDGYTKDR